MDDRYQGGERAGAGYEMGPPGDVPRGQQKQKPRTVRG
jgi:hypothetical protein